MRCVEDFGDGLYLVDLDLPLEGFRRFISSWVLVAGGTSVVVDPGPRATYAVLREALAGLGIERIEAILLTHIHIDHAGGAGLLARDFPEARILCHPTAIAHLADPTRLWEQSRKVLGDVAEAYGPIEPVERRRLEAAVGPEAPGDPIRFGALGPLRAIATPGHASHHVSYALGESLFVGEALGTYARLADGSTYLRPATPPVFDRATYLDSQRRLAGIPARRLCFAHHGARPAEGWDWQAASEQVELWLAVVGETLGDADASDVAGDANATGQASVAGDDSGSSVAGGAHAAADEAAIRRIFAEDRRLAGFASLPPDIKARELHFARNSLRGMRLYLRASSRSAPR